MTVLKGSTCLCCWTRDSGQPNLPVSFVKCHVIVCSGQSICVVDSLFVYWTVYLCNGQSICLVDSLFVYWTVYLCSGQSVCVLDSLFV